MLATQIRESVQVTLHELVRKDSYRVYLAEYSESLETELKDLLAATDCVLLSSGTAAMEVALRAAGIGAGDAVILSAYDYPGNFWAIERVGARPVLIDTEPDSWNVSLQQLEYACKTSLGDDCRALIASHLHGQLQNMPELRAFCDNQGMLLVEDCCQAIGATIDGKPVGSFGHASTLSFGGGKLISAGRGGSLLTSDPKLAQRARIAAGAGSGPYQMSEVQAAIVLAQLPWLPQINACCRTFFSQLQTELMTQVVGLDSQIILPWAHRSSETSFYQAGMLVRSGEAMGSQQSSMASGSGNHDTERPEVGKPEASAYGSRNALVDMLRSQGIPAGNGFDGFHRRSVRRCHIPAELENCPKVVAETMVIHHGLALAESMSPQQVAVFLVAARRSEGS